MGIENEFGGRVVEDADEKPLEDDVEDRCHLPAPPTAIAVQDDVHERLGAPMCRQPPRRAQEAAWRPARLRSTPEAGYAACGRCGGRGGRTGKRSRPLYVCMNATRAIHAVEKLGEVVAEKAVEVEAEDVFEVVVNKLVETIVEVEDLHVPELAEDAACGGGGRGGGRAVAGSAAPLACMLA
jgi:hypothetical protein